MKQQISTQLWHYNAWLAGFFFPLLCSEFWKSLRMCWDLFIISWNDGALIRPWGRSHMGCFLLHETDPIWTWGDAKECGFVLIWIPYIVGQLVVLPCPAVCLLSWCSDPVLSRCSELADHHGVWWLDIIPTALILAWWKQWFTHGLGFGSLYTHCMRRAEKCFLLV